VYLRLGLGDSGEDIQRPLPGPLAYLRAFDKGPDLPPGIVGVFVMMRVAALFMGVFVVVRVRMFMRMLVGVFVRVLVDMHGIFGINRPVVILGILVMGDMIAGSFQFHYRVGPADAVTLIRHKVKFPAADAKFPQFPADIPGIDPQIYQGAQGHIAGNSGKTLKVQSLQSKTPDS
jgi:hypothetical protein